MWQAEPSPTTYKQNAPLFKNTGKGYTLTTASRRKLGFFDLPPEIRLQIYETVNQLTPVVPRQLALGYPDYYPKPYIPRSTSDQATCSSSRRLLSPHRPRGYIPHALLRTCRRLYREARCVPFYENEFVFATWFSTGSSTALAFIRGLKAWQWAAMTYVRLEIPLEDIDGSNKLHLANWEALCEKWAFGLRGLRLTIVHLPNLMMLGSGGGGDAAEKRGASLAAICPAPGVEGSRVNYPWIDAGLKKLEALRRLEVELKTTMLTHNQKLDWCEGLKGMLSRGLQGGKEDVEIACVRAKVN
ncbi:hypothetical protein V8F33_003907 [Rhypophila sp. PSN 637]